MGSLGAESASLAVELSTKPTENGRSQLSGCGIDLKNHAKLAESIIWSRSRFRGVDFFASQATGVDV